jgi:hypothetical protein
MERGVRIERTITWFAARAIGHFGSRAKLSCLAFGVWYERKLSMTKPSGLPTAIYQRRTANCRLLTFPDNWWEKQDSNLRTDEGARLQRAAIATMRFSQKCQIELEASVRFELTRPFKCHDNFRDCADNPLRQLA